MSSVFFVDLGNFVWHIPMGRAIHGYASLPCFAPAFAAITIPYAESAKFFLFIYLFKTKKIKHMKGIKIFSLLVAVTLFVITGCRKDKNSTPADSTSVESTSYISIDDTKYTLEKGYHLTNEDVLAFTQGITLERDSSSITEKGSGHGFSIQSAGSGTNITSGTYPFSEIESTVVVNYNADTEEADYGQDL